MHQQRYRRYREIPITKPSPPPELTAPIVVQVVRGAHAKPPSPADTDLAVEPPESQQDTPQDTPQHATHWTMPEPEQQEPPRILQQLLSEQDWCDWVREVAE